MDKNIDIIWYSPRSPDDKAFKFITTKRKNISIFVIFYGEFRLFYTFYYALASD